MRSSPSAGSNNAASSCPRRLDIVVLDGAPAPDVEALTAWVTAAARHVLGAYGRFPVPRAQVVVTPVAGLDGRFGSSRREAVPFGRVLRDGGIGVQFFVRQTAGIDELLSDWTATHEFTPLAPLRPARRCVAFGRVRDLLPERAAGACRRARRKARVAEADGRVRARPARRLPRHARGIRFAAAATIGSRMYWSGAAIALLADVALRREHDASLDAALEGLQTCCLPSERAWSAEAVMTGARSRPWHRTIRSVAAAMGRCHDLPDVDGVSRRLA
jgi:hypothetical protein